MAPSGSTLEELQLELGVRVPSTASSAAGRVRPGREGTVVGSRGIKRELDARVSRAVADAVEPLSQRLKLAESSLSSAVADTAELRALLAWELRGALAAAATSRLGPASQGQAVREASSDGALGRTELASGGSPGECSAMEGPGPGMRVVQPCIAKEHSGLHHALLAWERGGGRALGPAGSFAACGLSC